MANPMDRWKHKRKQQELQTARNISKLEREPVYDEDRKCWKSVFSKTLDDRRENLPRVKGHAFHWNGTTYTAIGQSVITDTVFLRELNYPRRNPGIRAFMWVFLEEEDDDYFFIVKGMT